MNKLEECARALATLEGANYDARNFNETFGGNEPEEAREGYRDQVRAVIRCLMELKDRDVCACPKEPTHNNLEYYRAMLQSVLDGKE